MGGMAPRPPWVGAGAPCSHQTEVKGTRRPSVARRRPRLVAVPLPAAARRRRRDLSRVPQGPARAAATRRKPRRMLAPPVAARRRPRGVLVTGFCCQTKAAVPRIQQPAGSIPRPSGSRARRVAHRCQAMVAGSIPRPSRSHTRRHG